MKNNFEFLTIAVDAKEPICEIHYAVDDNHQAKTSVKGNGLQLLSGVCGIIARLLANGMPEIFLDATIESAKEIARKGTEEDE